MVTIVCPDCGRSAEFEEIRWSADEFCPACDFPLFWAEEETAGPDDQPGSRRLPGVAGLVRIGVVRCPVCAEPGELSSPTCARCGADLHPPDDLGETEPTPVPLLSAQPDPVAAAPPPTWTPLSIGLGLLAGALGVVLALVVVL